MKIPRFSAFQAPLTIALWANLGDWSNFGFLSLGVDGDCVGEVLCFLAESLEVDDESVVVSGLMSISGDEDMLRAGFVSEDLFIVVG